MSTSPSPLTPTQARSSRRAFLIRQLHQWHWISSALALAGMLLFAITGITLNHAGQIETTAKISQHEAVLPAPLRGELARTADHAPATLPASLHGWLADELGVVVHGTPEWLDGELYVSMPRAGGDAWLSIDLESGELEYESTDRGWIAYFNDLHKGRHTGVAWSWFIDLFAMVCLVFCISGLWLLQIHARKRPATWPLAGMGLLVMILLALLFIH